MMNNSLNYMKNRFYPIGAHVLLFLVCAMPIRPSLVHAIPSQLEQNSYFFGELLKGCQASYLEEVPLQSLVRAGLLSFVEASGCVLHWGSSQIKVRCYHESVAHDLPIDTADGGAQLLSKVVNLNTVSKSSVPALREAMAKGIVNSMGDPFTAYLSPAEVRQLKNYGHWSVGIAMDPKHPDRIHGVRPGSSADMRGVFVGDQILRVDGQSVKGKLYVDMSAILVGPPEERLTIELSRHDGIHRFQLNRSDEEAIPIWAQKINRDLLYMRPGKFDNGMADTMWVQLAPHAQVKGVVLDLRHNPGGLLSEGVSFLNGFVGQGKLGSVHPRVGHPVQKYTASQAQVLSGLPIVILVDGGAASVAEFVALVLKERLGAVLIGQSTLGKGRVQRVISLPDAGAMRISVAELVGPSGKRIRKSLDVEHFLAPAAGNTAISGKNPAEDSWVAYAVGLLRKNNR